MSTDLKSGSIVCKPRLNDYYFRKLHGERFRVDKSAGEAQLHASSSLNISDVEKGQLPITCTVELVGKRGEETELSVEVILAARFSIDEGVKQEQCEARDSFELIAAQVGPLAVSKSREIMQNLGFKGRGLSFFDPFSGWEQAKSEGDDLVEMKED